jgi:olefin beta-lactone synthetase
VLWLLGRCAARIGDLYPFSVEGAVLRHSAVYRAAVLAYHGRRILLVQWRDPSERVDPTEIRKSVAWAKLDAVIAVPEIPVDKRHNAKVDYRAAQRLLDGA